METKLKIEKNIPLPTREGYMASILRSMSAGDSIVLSTDKAPSWRSKATSLKMKVTLRKINEKETRFWRVK